MDFTLHYLDSLLDVMSKQWPENRTVNIVCHGHSVPAGYYATPFVNTFGAYPHLLHEKIKERFPFAAVNVIVTAIGGEDAVGGARRFETDVLTHRPDVVTIDYGLNDRSIGLEKAKRAWESMIAAALRQNVKVILLTPTWDNSYYEKSEQWSALEAHAAQIRALAAENGVGLADSFASFGRFVREEGDLALLLSHVNHPTKRGHMLVADELSKFFPAR